MKYIKKNQDLIDENNHLQVQLKENSKILDEYKALVCQQQEKRREEQEELALENTKNIEKQQELHGYKINESEKRYQDQID